MITKEIIEIYATLSGSAVILKATYPDNETETVFLRKDYIQDNYSCHPKDFFEKFADNETQLKSIYLMYAGTT